MESVLHIIHTIVSGAASIGCLVLELFGVAILIFNGVKAFIHYIDNNPETSVSLGEGIAMGLEFLLAGASAVEVGAQNFVDPYVCVKIIDDLPRVLKQYGYTSVKDVIERSKR